VERSGLSLSGLAGWAAAARGVIDFPACANLRPGLLASEYDIREHPRRGYWWLRRRKVIQIRP